MKQRDIDIHWGRHVQDKELEQQLKKQDIQLLVTQLMRNEETLIKLIIDRLYDAGSENWIDKKIQFRLANRGLKTAARVAKPAGRYFGYRWLVKKTPRMIAGWLMRQVSFKPKKKKAPQQVKPVPQSILLSQQKQINKLQTRLRLTSGLAVVSVISVGGLLVMQNSSVLTQQAPTEPRPISQTQRLP